MRRITLCIVLLACFVRISPVAAQTTPNPTTLVQEVSEATQTLGILTVVVLAALGILAIIVVIVLVIAARGLSPLLGTIKSLNEARGELQDELFKRLQAGDKERSKTAEINERTVSVLSELETKQQATEGRESAVKELMKHTDSAHDVTRKEIAELRKKVSTVIQSLERVEKRLGGSDGDDTADLSLSAAFHMLKHIERRLDQLGTGPLDPAKVPDTDPAAGSTQKEPDPWQTDDNPPNLPPETE